MTIPAASLLAIDVGEKRIGVARASTENRLAAPLKTLDNNPDIFQEIKELVLTENAQAIIIGLPRGLSGQITEQTKTTQKFGETLGASLNVPVYWQDEAVTSLKAKEELEARDRPYNKGDVDALAATYILEDFLNENPEDSYEEAKK